MVKYRGNCACCGFGSNHTNFKGRREGRAIPNPCYVELRKKRSATDDKICTVCYNDHLAIVQKDVKRVKFDEEAAHALIDLSIANCVIFLVNTSEKEKWGYFEMEVDQYGEEISGRLVQMIGSMLRYKYIVWEYTVVGLVESVKAVKPYDCKYNNETVSEVLKAFENGNHVIVINFRDLLYGLRVNDNTKTEDFVRDSKSDLMALRELSKFDGVIVVPSCDSQDFFANKRPYMETLQFAGVKMAPTWFYNGSNDIVSLQTNKKARALVQLLKEGIANFVVKLPCSSCGGSVVSVQGVEMLNEEVKRLRRMRPFVIIQEDMGRFPEYRCYFMGGKFRFCVKTHHARPPHSRDRQLLMEWDNVPHSVVQVAYASIKAIQVVVKEKDLFFRVDVGEAKEFVFVNEIEDMCGVGFFTDALGSRVSGILEQWSHILSEFLSKIKAK